MPTQAERRAATRSAILGAAHDLFGRRGYAATTISDVLDAAGVSRGALYHHFASKEDLFAAVFLRTSTETIREALCRVPKDASPRDALVAGCTGWLEAAIRPATAQILLIDGPAALGWERSRTLEEATSLGVMRQAIAAAVEAGELSVPSINVAARLVNAVLAEAAIGLGSGSSRRARIDATETVTAFIEGLAPRRD